MNSVNSSKQHQQPGAARYGIALARFNSFVVDRLLDGALEVLHQQGVPDDHISLVRVPGAYELPLAVKKMAASGRYQAIIALGAVIRGGTPHFEYVAGECARGLSQVSLDAGLPVAFGVLTVDTVEQAIERAATGADNRGSNKGAAAALTAMEMVNLLSQLES